MSKIYFFESFHGALCIEKLHRKGLFEMVRLTFLHPYYIMCRNSLRFGIRILWLPGLKELLISTISNIISLL